MGYRVGGRRKGGRKKVGVKEERGGGERKQEIAKIGRWDIFWKIWVQI